MDESTNQPPPGTFSALMADGQRPNPQSNSPKSGNRKPASKVARRTPRHAARHTSSNTAGKAVVFDKQDIDDLRASAYVPQTFRLSENNAQWLSDVTESLNKKAARSRRQKVTKVEIVRIALKLFEKFLAEQPDELLRILREI